MTKTTVSRKTMPVPVADPPSRVMPVFWRADATGRIVSIVGDTMDGGSAGAWIGPAWLDAVHPDDRDLILRRWSGIAERGRLEPTEYRTRSADGRYRWVTAAALPERDRDGRITGWIGTVTDIDDERRTRDALNARETQLRLGIEASGIGIFEVEIPSLKASWRPELLAMFGLPPDTEMDEATFRRVVHPDDVDRAFYHFNRCIDERDETPWRVSYRIRRADTGEERWVEEVGHLAVDPATGPSRIVGAFSDITQRKTEELARQRNEERWRLALQTARMVAWERDLDTGMISRSANAAEILGVIDEPVADFLSRIHPADRALFESSKQSRSGGAKGPVQFRYLHPDGREVWLESIATLIHRDGAPDAVVGVASDITERKLADSRLHFAATHDSLTGLLNRDGFQAALAQVISGGPLSGTDLTLLLIDLDNFKDVNDSLGHDAGDVILIACAQRLRAAFGQTAALGRIGGDEFAILLDTTDADALQATARDLLERLAVPIVHRGTPLAIRASLGIAPRSDVQASAVDLMKEADLALYRAKRDGRGRAKVFEAGLREEIDSRMTLSRGVRAALADGGIVPFYQPKIDLLSGAIAGFEALVRWRHPERGILTAGAFLPALEDPELAVLIDERMFEAAFDDIAKWTAAGLDPGRIAFNMSSASITRPDAAERLLEGMASARIEARHVQVEVTESVLLDNRAETVDTVLRTLRKAGVTIALDDFGTGYASLTHLKRFPVDEIKIDQTFVRDLEADADDAAIVSAVIGLGANLGLAVVAEGVETDGQAGLLRYWGCGFGQGYLFSRPVPAEDVPRLLAEDIARTSRLHLAIGYSGL